MSGANNCPYCKKNYASKHTLNTHIKTSKKCIALRGDTANDVYECEHCSFTSIVKNNYDRHLKICKRGKAYCEQEKNELIKKITELDEKNKILNEKISQSERICRTNDSKNKILNEKLDTKNRELKSYKSTISRLEYVCKTNDEKINQLHIKNTELENRIMEIFKQEAKEYKDHVMKLSEKPTNSINNTQINLAPLDLSTETIAKVIQDRFTLDHISIAGVVKFLVDNLIGPIDGVPRYSCSDASRNMFKYKSIDGKINKDIKATKLIDAIKNPIRDKSIELAGPETQRLFRMSCESQDVDVSALTDIHLNELSNGLFKVKYLGDNSAEFSRELAVKTK